VIGRKEEGKQERTDRCHKENEGWRVESRDSSVGIAIPGRQGFVSRQGQDFSTLQSIHTGSGVQLLVKWVPEAISQEVTRLGREAYHSPPSSAEVKNGGTIPPLPLISLHGIVLS
jgi:hypothetical protein